MSAETVRIRLEPWSVEIEAPRGSPLMPVLSANGVEFPCGGTGICGGCGVRLISGSLPVSVEDKAAFRPDEIACGWRLACRARVEEPLVLECGQWQMNVLTDDTFLKGAGKHGLGIAIDLGTTTIAAQVIDLGSGRVLGVRTALNPQMQAGADVMSRIRAVLLGADLKNVVRAELRTIVSELAGGRAQEVCEVLIVGNTVMHHLFCGLDVEPLAGAPFVTPHPEARCFTPADLGWPLPGNCTIRFEACIGSFVGADTLAGIIATGMAEGEGLAALIDLGTNGEIAIGNRNGLVCASTAAGPAFEAGCIRMGMRASPGAIAHVEPGDGGLRASTIGDAEARGICGSGIVDAVAAGLDAGAILPSGRVANGTKVFPVSGVVSLYQSDIRELQLAKAAIASGFSLLLDRLGAGIQDVERIHLAGAFGNYVRIESAVRIGLIEAPIELIHAAGNTALRGAKMMMLAREEPALPMIEHVCLASVEGFQDRFATCMGFPASHEHCAHAFATP
ncbi:MAG TPA: ASKHA domain-containing protein [Terracidiphilus sp.]|nr:ASKHA domain-containing protein [Terracidiphilus sp.]